MAQLKKKLLRRFKARRGFEREYDFILCFGDPASGKRIPRVNPEAEWIVEPVPALRIVDDALWQAVAARLEEAERSPRVRKLRASRFWERRRPGHLLTGLVRCGSCGGRVTAVGGAYLACAAARITANTATG